MPCLLLPVLLLGSATSALLPAAPPPRHTVRLHNAVNESRGAVFMPLVGLGTGGYAGHSHPDNITADSRCSLPLPSIVECWDDITVENHTSAWFKAGGRALDTALSYATQNGVGRALKKSGLAREEVWITSKVPLGSVYTMKQEDVFAFTLQAFANVTRELDVEYVDLLLTHWPGCTGGAKCPRDGGRGHRQENWKALNSILRAGGARAIGVSNYEMTHIHDVAETVLPGGEAGMLPAVNQVEYHPYYHQDDLVAACRKLNIQFDAYGPLGTPDVVLQGGFGRGEAAGHGGPPQPLWAPTALGNPAVARIAKAHGSTAAQVIVAWITQQGIVTHPRTRDPAHMKQNLAAPTLELSEQEMGEMSSHIKVPDCSGLKAAACPVSTAQAAAGCCKICPITTDIP